MEKVLDKIDRFKKEISASYGVELSSIVWIGNNNFAVVLPGGKEVFIKGT